MQVFKLFAAITAITTLTLTFFVSANGSDQNAQGPLKRIEALRSETKEAGIDLQLTYTGEVFHSSDLIPDGATNYRGLVELALTLDTTKLGLWRDGEIFVVGQTGHGQGLDSAAAGNLFPISNIDAPDFTEVSQYGVNQRFLDGSLQLQAGKQDVNSLFAVNDFGSQFVNPSYTLISNVPMPTFPAPALGFTLQVEAPAPISFDAGIYDGAPKINSLGVDSAFDGKGGYFAIFEPGWKPAFGVDGRYSGNYRVGLWYHTGDFAETRSTDVVSGNYGVYAMIDQMIYKEPSSGKDLQGMGVFLQFGWAPADRNPVTRYLGAGFSYNGLLPSRDQDTLGFGISYSRLAGQLSSNDERYFTNIEVFYAAAIWAGITLQPDIQYFSNGGEDGNQGWAVGMRWVLTY